jgi:drug/metabolite transporter (DMT)-like permease
VPSPTKHRPLGFLAAALASSFWGCGFYFGKIALAEMNVGAMVFYRFAFATLCLLPLLVMYRPSFNAAEWRLLLFGTFLGVPLQFLLQFKGLSLTTASHASLMVGTLPVILAVGATVYMVTAYGLVAGTLMLALYVPFAYGPPPLHGISLKVWAALIASGLLCTAATTLLWNWGMTQVPASQAGVLLNMEPLIGSLLGVFLLSEHLGDLAWLGGGMILTAAITLTTHSSTPLEDPAMI